MSLKIVITFFITDVNDVVTESSTDAVGLQFLEKNRSLYTFVVMVDCA